MTPTTLTRDVTKTIGASTVPAILGLSPFCTPLKQFNIMTGVVTPDPENESMEWGKRLERVVSEKFSDAHGVKLMAYKRRFVHKDMPFFSCELDNIIVGTDEIVEIKTVGANSWKKWADPEAIPDYVIAQVQAQMGLSGRKVAWVACLCGGQKYVEKRIEFDAEFYSKIEEAVRGFMALVENNTPPMAMAADNDDLVDIYPQRNDQIQAIEEKNAQIALMQQLKNDRDAIDEQIDGIEAELKQIIGVSQGIRTSRYMVTWKEQIRNSLDSKALKVAMPEVYDRFAKATATRVLRVSLNGGK